jgi:hypothetical protein
MFFAVLRNRNSTSSSEGAFATPLVEQLHTTPLSSDSNQRS